VWHTNTFNVLFEHHPTHMAEGCLNMIGRWLKTAQLHNNNQTAP
jgi:hypothetical protein